MRVVFVWTGASESIGIEYLSSVLKKVGHQTSLVFDHNLFDDKRYLSIKWLAKLFNKRKKVVEDILRAKPELVMFSVFTYSYNWACSIAKELKRHSDVPVIFGGIHVSSVPDVVIKNDFVDMICIGEAEEAVVELAEALSEQKTYYHIKNLWFKDNGQIIKNDLRSLANDLDSRPFPDKKLFLTEFPIFNEYTIMTGRGCPYSCSFCFNSFYKEIYNGKGKYYRRRSVENVILELIDAKKKYKIKKVHFFDDIFTIDRPWLLKFLMQYKKKIKLPFQCLAHFDTVDRPLLVLLKKPY